MEEVVRLAALLFKHLAECKLKVVEAGNDFGWEVEGKGLLFGCHVHLRDERLFLG